MEKVVAPLIQQQWAKEIDKGREIYLTRETDKNKRFETLKTEVEEAVEKQEGNYQELWEEGKKKVLKEHRDSLLNLSHFERMGVARARLDEAAAGYGNYRINELQTSEDTVYDDNGTPFLLKDYKDPSLVGAYEAASSHIYAKYYIENKGDFTPKYLNAKFVPELMKTEVKQKSEYYAQLRRETTNQRIDNLETIFDQALKTNNPKDIARSITTSHIAIPALFDDLGAKEGGNVAWRKSFVLAGIQKFAAQNPNADVNQIIEGLKLATINHPNGKKNLFDLYSDEFSPFQIKQIFNKAKADQASLLKSADENSKVIFEEKVDEARDEAWANGTRLDDKFIQNSLSEAGRLNYTQDELTALDYKLRLAPMSDVESTAFLEREAERFGGQLSTAQVIALSQTKGLSKLAINDLKERKIIVDEPFLTAKPELLAAITEADKTLEDDIKLLSSKFDNPHIKLDAAHKRAVKVLKEQGIQGTNDPNIDTVGGLYEIATSIYEQNQKDFAAGLTDVQLTKEQAIEQATGQLTSKLKLLNANRDYENHILYNSSKKGFQNLTAAHMSPLYNERIRDNLTLDEMETNVLKEGIQGLYNRPPSTLTIDDFHVGPSTGNMPSRIMQLAAAADETGKYDPWDFMHKWQEVILNNPSHPLHEELKLKPALPKPAELTLLREKIPARYIYELTNWKDNKKVLRRALKAADITEVSTVVRTFDYGLTTTVQKDFKGEIIPGTGTTNENYMVTKNGKVLSETEFLIRNMRIPNESIFD